MGTNRVKRKTLLEKGEDFVSSRQALRCAEDAGYVGIDTNFRNSRLLTFKMFVPRGRMTTEHLHDFSNRDYYDSLSSLSKDCVCFKKEEIVDEVYTRLQEIMIHGRIKKVFFDGQSDLKALEDVELYIPRQQIVNIKRLDPDSGLSALYISYDLGFPCPSPVSSSVIGPCYDAIYLPYIVHIRKTNCQDLETGKSLAELYRPECITVSSLALSTASNNRDCPYFTRYCREGVSWGKVAGVIATAGAAFVIGYLLHKFLPRSVSVSETNLVSKANLVSGDAELSALKQFELCLKRLECLE